MKRRGFTFIQMVIALLVVMILAALLIPMFGTRKSTGVPANCFSNMPQLAKGLMQYAGDYDGKLPPVAVTNTIPFGWADAIFPYVRNSGVYQCPQQKSAPSSWLPNLTGYTDYWLNARVDGLNAGASRYPARILLFGEGNDGVELTNARYAKASLPLAWLGDSAKPPYRHWDTGHYCFVDGHCKRIKPAEIRNESPEVAAATFRVK